LRIIGAGNHELRYEPAESKPFWHFNWTGKQAGLPAASLQSSEGRQGHCMRPGMEEWIEAGHLGFFHEKRRVCDGRPHTKPGLGFLYITSSAKWEAQTQGTLSLQLRQKVHGFAR
jgi:hypothetical protein